MLTTITVSGPQASGKTTLAMALGKSMGFPVFSRDPLMKVLMDSGVPVRARHGLKAVPVVGLELQTVLLKRQLELGQSCILECVMPSAARALWRQMTAQAQGRFVSVECACSDRAEHRARFERRQHAQGGRGRGRSGRRFDWSYVESTVKRYQADQHADYLADSIQPTETLVTAIRSLITQPGP